MLRSFFHLFSQKPANGNHNGSVDLVLHLPQPKSPSSVQTLSQQGMFQDFHAKHFILNAALDCNTGCISGPAHYK